MILPQLRKKENSVSLRLTLESFHGLLKMVLKIIFCNFCRTFAFYSFCYDPRLFDYGGYGFGGFLFGWRLVWFFCN